jgi:ATP-binding cassette subfamily C protein
MASGTRIAPAILRIQQGIIQIQGNIGAATPTIQLIDVVASIQPLSDVLNLDESSIFNGTIEIKNLVYGYTSSKKFKIEISNLLVEEGSFTAIVGPSGSGKSTLVDLILGINPPLEGEILISGEPPGMAVSLWPNAVAYVPQSIIEINGSLLENVLFGYAPGEKSIDDVKQALGRAELQDLFVDSPNALESKIGKNGSKLSGGERQRLGISRALLGHPKLIILDEATSSLDSQTENRISETLNKLKGNLTLLVVAHRLSTVKNADKVIYMSNGQIIAQGTFQEVKDQIPDFETSAKLLGL